MRRTAAIESGSGSGVAVGWELIGGLTILADEFPEKSNQDNEGLPPSRIGLRGIGYDWAARSSVAMSSFFICIMACIALGCLISYIIRVGTICHDRPYLSLSQPHATSVPPAVSFDQ